MYKFICDCCGTELEHHGERYIVRVEQVPGSYSGKNRAWDLCPACAERLVNQLDERRRQCVTTS